MKYQVGSTGNSKELLSLRKSQGLEAIFQVLRTKTGQILRDTAVRGIRKKSILQAYVCNIEIPKPRG